MAFQGVCWNCNTETIVNALVECNGKITYAAKKLGVKYDTLRKRIDREPALAQLLIDLRDEYETTLLDLAEQVVGKSMSNIDKDPNNALKAAFFTLNSKGHTRGWSNTMGEPGKNQKVVFEVNYPNSENPVKVSSEEIPASDPEGTQ